jgi:enamine deaminase RidA (YjgF/YER057c/UK114 family)
MPERHVIIPEGMEILYERYHYCPGVRVGDTLYIAGQVGRDGAMQVVAEPEAQFVQAFENVNRVLTAAGATFDQVVEMVTYHVTSPELYAASGQEPFTLPYLPLFIQVKDRFFTRHYPTWTGVGITSLSTPGLIVEIKCIAVLGD